MLPIMGIVFFLGFFFDWIEITLIVLPLSALALLMAFAEIALWLPRVLLN